MWLIFNSPMTVKGYTYEITGTNSSYDSGILKISFTQCRKTNIDDFVAKYRTPTIAGVHPHGPRRDRIQGELGQLHNKLNSRSSSALV